MILDETHSDDYLSSVRKGTFKKGLELGCGLDENLVFKHGTFNCIIGQANVGKTDWIIWYLSCLTIKHKLSWLIYSSENSIGSIKRKIIEYMTGKLVTDLDEPEFHKANKMMNFYFKFVDTNKLYSGYDLIKVFETNKEIFDGAVIDPYNSLTKDLKGTNSHEYDYQMASEFRLFCKKHKKTVYVVAHCVTESLRRVFTREHPYAGYPVPPTAADIEGGGKWVNRADDFIVLHRYTQHKYEWFITQVHVKKVKETETGGKPTYIDEPVKCTKHYQSFIINNVNPIGLDRVEKPLPLNKEFDWMTEEPKDDIPF